MLLEDSEEVRLSPTVNMAMLLGTRNMPCACNIEEVWHWRQWIWLCHLGQGPCIGGGRYGYVTGEACGRAIVIQGNKEAL